MNQPLKRVLGAPTAWLIGMGVAIGSGIFRTPGEVAAGMTSEAMLLFVWVLAGLIVLLQGLVTAELATRFPKAGGEYVFLREAYGRFVAFFFGWAYTVFIIGGGAASIALAFGDFGCALLGLGEDRSTWLAVGCIVAVTGLNSIGLRAGAWAQNVMTALKILSVVAVTLCGFAFEPAVVEEVVSSSVAAVDGAGDEVPRSWILVLLAALVPALWPYEGTTDAVKMAEEVSDVRRALPIAIIGSTLSLIVLYTLVNAALLRVIPLEQMSEFDSVPGEAMGRLFGASGRRAMLAVAMIVCVGSLSSTVLATVRVTFALARDGLAFGFLARMSGGQQPVPALVTVGVIASALCLWGNFGEVLGVYFFASAILFSLSYASLIVFRIRDEQPREHLFLCPLGVPTAVFLIAIHVALAVGIAIAAPRSVAGTVILLAVLGSLYLLWKRGAGEVGAVSDEATD